LSGESSAEASGPPTGAVCSELAYSWSEIGFPVCPAKRARASRNDAEIPASPTTRLDVVEDDSIGAYSARPGHRGSGVRGQGSGQHRYGG